MKWTILATLLALLGASDASAQERALRWSRLAVTAHLDADGLLHVTERHSMVFDGPWNGGERKFRLDGREVVHVEGISRVDESGAMIPLTRDDSLAAIDSAGWVGTTLRWRSRLPSDPPFERREITYVLQYTHSHTLIPAAGRFQFDHNFGLPDTEWPIDVYTLDLTIDPIWQPVDRFPAHIERSKLPRGDDVVVATQFGRTGDTLPASVHFGPSARERYGLLALLLAAAAFQGLRFLRRERALGRLEPLADPASIDRQWLEQQLLTFPPEVVGALWDNTTNAAEVAALIARMVQEKKLSSRLEGKELGLTLLCPRESLDGYEKTLVDSLFIAGDTTSTSAIKAHYKTSGFDPAAKISGLLQARLGTLAASNDAPPVGRAMSLLFTLAGVALLLVSGVRDGENVAGAVEVGGTIVGFYLFGCLGAFDYRRRLTDLGFRSLQIIVPVVLILAAPARLLLFGEALQFDTLMLGGAALLALGAAGSLLNLAKSRDGGERLQQRRRLAAAREFFVRELRKPQPALDDAWFPYVLAFGLGRSADHWFRSFSGESSSRTRFDSSSASTWGSSSSGQSGWTGFAGGGSGGAGASGSWAAAAGGMAAGVARPGSSRSGGGGGGGGGRSGGGGGGGW